MLSFFFRKWGVIALSLLCLLSPLTVFAQQGVTTTTSGRAEMPTTQSMTLSIPLGQTTQVSNLAEYIAAVYRYMLGIVTTLAIIMVVYGGFQYLLGATMSQVKGGQQTIENALGGMVVLLLAYVILYTVNPATVSLRMPGVEKINEIGVTEGGLTAYQNVAGGSCAVDADCPAGGACLRTSAVGGLCANGQQGNICQCRGTGCDITNETAGGPTNNSAAQAPITRGHFACQSGLHCAKVSEPDDYQCAGGRFSVCNLTTGERCTAENQYCFQPAEGLAGACVYGDQQDAAIFEGIPDFRQNEDLRHMVEHCTTDDTFARTTPKALGGCRNVTSDGVDDYCMHNRYHCSGTSSVCGEDTYATLFAPTLRAYRNWSNVPNQMKTDWYYAPGCRKSVGQSCTSDAECPSACVNAHCAGFGALVTNASTPSMPGGQLPTSAQVAYVTSATGCGNDTWTIIDLWSEAQTAGNAVAADFSLRTLFAAGMRGHFSCYPVRPVAAKCDLNSQCQSGTCTVPTGVRAVSTPPTFAAPLDNTLGVGTCS